MKLGAALLLQFAGFGLVLHLGPWGLAPGLALLILGGRLYRFEQRKAPPPWRRRALFYTLFGVASVLAVVIALFPFLEPQPGDAAFAASASVATAAGDSDACVFVLHGLARPSATQGLAAGLAREGFSVIRVAYRSTQGTFEDMVAPLAATVAAQAAACSRMDFVGYSLGALVIRGYLTDRPPSNVGRVVMIAPPNQGSELADRLGVIWLFRQAVGSVAAQLGTSEQSLPRRLPPPRYPLGIIAGDQSGNLLGQLLIPGPHDGAVSVASTQLSGMTAFLRVHRTHHFIVDAPEVLTQTVAFLQRGSFNP